MNGKQPLIYGSVGEQQPLVLMPEQVANAFAEDHERIWALTTYGEARRFIPKALNTAPGLADYDENSADEDPYDAAQTSEYLNGDWPPSAATIALDHLPDDLDDMVMEVEHLMDSPTLELIAISEADLLTMLKQRGYEVRRDDELIRRI